MSKRLVLPDTNILILASQGKFDLLTLFEQYDDILLSIISKVEALGFHFVDSNEEQLLLQFLQELTILPFADAEAQHAITYRKAKKIKLPDAAILATARGAGADLLTQNTADFRGLDPAVRVLAIEDL